MRIEYFQLIDRITDLNLPEKTIHVEATVPTTSTIFEGHFPLPSCATTVPGGKSIACSTPEAIAWDAAFAAAADPSGRAMAGVHDAAL